MVFYCSSTSTVREPPRIALRPRRDSKVALGKAKVLGQLPKPEARNPTRLPRLSRVSDQDGWLAGFPRDENVEFRSAHTENLALFTRNRECVFLLNAFESQQGWETQGCLWLWIFTFLIYKSARVPSELTPPHTAAL